MKKAHSTALGFLLFCAPTFAVAATPVTPATPVIPAAPVTSHAQVPPSAPRPVPHASVVSGGAKPAVQITTRTNESMTTNVRATGATPHEAIGTTIRLAKSGALPADGQKAATEGPAVTFPTMPSSLQAKAGDQIHLSMPAEQLSSLQPSGTSHDGPSIFYVQVQYKVDGGPVQSVVVAAPHSTGQGGYDGTAPVGNAAITIPAGAKQVQYWFVGSATRDPSFSGGDVGPAKYFSNYGQNFRVDVKP